MSRATSNYLSIFAIGLVGCNVFLPTEGYLDQPCMSHQECMLDLECVDSRCVAAGADGAPCHHDGVCDDSDAVCFSGTCYITGLEGQACRQDACIPSSLRCLDQLCVAVGTEGQPCGADGTCEAELECRVDLCIAVGGLAQPCRTESTCDGTLRCINDVCTEVGGEGGPCNTDGSCNTDNLVCLSDVCTPTGHQDQPCKSDGTCAIGLACHENTCLALQDKIISLPHGAKIVRVVRFHSDGQRILTAGDDTYARLWNYHDGTLLAVFVGHNGIIEDAAISPVGDLVATGSRDLTLRVWALDGTLNRTLTVYDVVTATTFCAQTPGKLAIGYSGGSIRVYNTNSGTDIIPLFSTRAADVTAARYSNAGDVLATASTDGSAALWRGPSYPEPPTSLLGNTSAITFVAFSHDDSLLATAHLDGSVKLWQTSDGALVRTLSAHNADALGVAFSPDGLYMATCGSDDTLGAIGTVRLFAVTDGAQVATYRQSSSVYSVDFSPDSLTIAGADKFDVVLWSLPPP